MLGNTRSAALAALLLMVPGTPAAAQGPGAAERTGAGGQQPAPASASASTEAPPAAAATAPGYAYDPRGRRDPFVSLVKRGGDRKSAGTHPAGLPGLLIGDVIVKGIVRDRSGFIAMIQGPDSKQTFIVRSGEKLMDGVVKAITADGVVFSQDVNDPLSLVKQKEIRKSVRATDGGRG
jgi:hypothetical protein